MAIRLDDLLALESPRVPVDWSTRDTLLYALSLGYGHDPLDPAQLAYVGRPEPSIVPAMGTVLAWSATPDRSRMGIDYSKVVHGEHRVVLHRPLSSRFAGWAQGRVVAAYDRGPDRGALIEVETIVSDAAGAPVATSTSTLFARADGGFGGPPPPVVSLPVPLGPPNHVVSIGTRPEQALLYRLNGDLNPLHADPDTAAKAGFDRPILHGLCTFGLACRAVLEATRADPAEVFCQTARFVGPVFPGETIEVDVWTTDGPALFQVRAPERNKVVVSNGRMHFRGEI